MPPAARFCPSCGAATTTASAPERGAERRFVTILFVDLVGFTERSDRADPEDVRTTLVPYHARVKEDLERFGGTLDKFIGDAVMGVFGAPVAHDDDPARAVRAGLRMLEGIEDLRRADPALQVRVAVNTGEAVVATGTGPVVGEAVAGDVVNTASRMQSLAPPGGLVIGEVTERLTHGIFETTALPAAFVKGKAEPLRVWQVHGERAPGTGRRDLAPFVGRVAELSGLEDLVRRARAGSMAHVVTVAGEAGIGKSRLVEELRARVDGAVDWHESRCVAYGDTSKLEPIARLVRAVLGVPATAAPEDARARLYDWATARAAADAGLARWLVDRLAALLGVDTVAEPERHGGSLPAERASIPAAEMASVVAEVLRPAARPVVAVVQDLHWAEPVVLEVLASAAVELASAPVVVLVTARPELFDRKERWPPAGANATVVHLGGLSAEETGRLVAAALSAAPPSMPAGSSLLDRAGGNPLFALEFVRMLGERGDAAGRTGIPDSVRAVVGARLDTIPDPLRATVQDAAVVGAEVWPGALVALSGVPVNVVRERVVSLLRRGVMARRPSSLPGEEAFGFAHDLFREVAYGRVPRARRARLHLAAARWLASALGARAGERADALAAHLATAADLATAAREPDVAATAAREAVPWLLAAAQRSLRTDVAGAADLYERALAFATETTRERAEALTGSALAGRRSGRLSPAEVLRRYEEAYEVFGDLGDAVSAGRTLVRIGSQLGAMGETDRSRGAYADAVDTLERERAGPELAIAYAYRGEDWLFAGDRDAAIADANAALEILSHDAGDEVAVMALHIRGDARCSKGDPAGLDDLRRALDLARASGADSDVVTSENYLAEWLWAYEGAGPALEHFDRAIDLAASRGIVSQGEWGTASTLALLYETGEWDELLRRAEGLLSSEQRLDAAVRSFARTYRAMVLAQRGGAADVPSADDLVGTARRIGDLQVVAPALVAAAWLDVAAGEPAPARERLEEFARLTSGAAPEYRESYLADVARLATRTDAIDVVERLLGTSAGSPERYRCHGLSARAALAEVRGEPGASDRYAEAAAAWRALGSPREAALAEEGRDRCAAARSRAR